MTAADLNWHNRARDTKRRSIRHLDKAWEKDRLIVAWRDEAGSYHILDWYDFRFQPEIRADEILELGRYSHPISRRPYDIYLARPAKKTAPEQRPAESAKKRIRKTTYDWTAIDYFMTKWAYVLGLPETHDGFADIVENWCKENRVKVPGKTALQERISQLYEVHHKWIRGSYRSPELSGE
jgi:hypothetical protein